MKEITLVVKSPFRNYKKGDQITDRKEITKILKCHEHRMIVKTQRADKLAREEECL